MFKLYQQNAKVHQSIYNMLPFALGQTVLFTFVIYIAMESYTQKRRTSSLTYECALGDIKVK